MINEIIFIVGRSWKIRAEEIGTDDFIAKAFIKNGIRRILLVSKPNGSQIFVVYQFLNDEFSRMQPLPNGRPFS